MNLDADSATGGAQPVATGGALTGGTASGGAATGGESTGGVDAGDDAHAVSGGAVAYDSGSGGTVATGGGQTGGSGGSGGMPATGGQPNECRSPLETSNTICDESCPVEPPDGDGGVWCDVFQGCRGDTEQLFDTARDGHDLAWVLPESPSHLVGSLSLRSGFCARYTATGGRTFIRHEGEPSSSDCSGVGEGDECLVVTSSDAIGGDGMFLSPRCSRNRPEATRCEWVLVVTPAGATRGWVMAESRELRNDGSCPLSCP